MKFLVPLIIFITALPFQGLSQDTPFKMFFGDDLASVGDVLFANQDKLAKSEFETEAEFLLRLPGELDKLKTDKKTGLKEICVVTWTPPAYDAETQQFTFSDSVLPRLHLTCLDSGRSAWGHLLPLTYYFDWG